MSEKKRVAIIISGRGSNMNALIDAAHSADYPAEIVGVISNKGDAEGLVTAGHNNIPTAVISIKDFNNKAAADEAIDAQLKNWGVDIVCLAGFMRILSAEFCEKWHGKALNIHPSLLPAFKGLDTHTRVLEDGMTEHGCTVHFVTAEMDEGEIIAQVAVPIEFGDTPSILAERVLKAEHKIYPWALAQVASGEITLEPDQPSSI